MDGDGDPDAELLKVTVHAQMFMYDSLGRGVADRPVRCPQCGSSTGLVLYVVGHGAEVGCPQGHVFQHPWITEAWVRAVYRQSLGVEEGTLTVSARPEPLVFRPLPALPDDLVTEQPAAVDATPADKQRLWWAATTHSLGHGRAPLLQCLGHAERLWSWALNHNPPLGYPRPSDADPTDEHMAVVVLALALYDAAQSDNVSNLRELPLAGPSAVLQDPHVRVRLAGLHPSMGTLGGRLRRSDQYRLDHADDQQWAGWVRAARDTLDAVDLWAADLQRQFAPGPQPAVAYLGRVLAWLPPGDGASWYTPA